MLSHDNSSHNLSVAHKTWDTHGLRPTNLRVKSIDLQVYLVGFIVSQNHMVVGGLTHPIYMQIHNPLLLSYRCEILST